MIKTFNRIFLCFLVCLCLWLVGLLCFIGIIPSTPSSNKKPADAIVVLTGGSNRLEYGLQLLSEGMGKQLFITGVHENISVENLIARNASPTVKAALFPDKASAIILGHEAENTIGNAEETKRWLEAEHLTSIRLVTSNYHMPRSMVEFTKTIPGVIIIPSPVMPDDFSLINWWEVPESRNLLLSEYHKYLASVARHFILSAMHHS